MKIIFRNLSRDTSEPQLHALFSAHGAVQSCVLVMDQLSGQSKGFGFVNMPVVAEAKLAIKHLNGSMLDGQKIRVKKAQDTPNEAPKPDSRVAEAPREAAVAAKPTPKLKKDGKPLGPKKARSFKKRP